MSRLPNFLYIGPDKAGSSWLHETLIRHPQVYLSPAKDLYFFDRYFDRGVAWYADQFRSARDEPVVGEICQDYLFHPLAAERIASVLTEPRFMVSLRDPVERAWSSFLYARKHGVGPADFMAALRTEDYLLEHSRYATGLDRFTARFPRSALHLAVFDDLSADPQAFLDATTDFLGIDRMPLREEERAARLSAASARSVRVAHTVRRTADWVREHNGARVVGAVKRSPLVQRVLYRPLDKGALRPDPEAVDLIRAELGGELDRLESDYGLALRDRWGWP
ncbi:MAG TPA: sulfotransferase [Nocardioides sp.]|uniref:sulfotransferase family protein n=1 Tax=Nocardioides sp. TaxID=35761 RepID=UPI002C6F4E3E|nr:sulfotransferase [Nocardioides sp.]HQR26673.1 sulfotransferase [Nocardioides sp.]